MPETWRTRVLGCIAALVIVAACGADPPSYRGPGTTAMTSILRDVAADFEARGYPYAASARLRRMEQFTPPTDLRSRLTFGLALGEGLFNAGRFEEAIAQFNSVLDETDRYRAQVPPEFVQEVRGTLAIAYFQLSQRDNCVQIGGTPRCLMPTPPEGLHVNGEGDRYAIREWHTTLAAYPDHMGLRWLLNLAYMATGDYPDGAASQWLIPPRVFESEYDITRFQDVAPHAGVRVLGHAGGGIADDFDRDGRLDIVASSWGVRDQLRYFRNLGNGMFAERTDAAGLRGIVGGLNIIHADYDNDGYLDILVLRGGWIPQGHPNSLLRNNGDGTFEDVTAKAGLLDPWYPTQTASWGDYDNDGWLDLFIGNESQDPARNPSQLFHNDGDGTFTDVARETGTDVVGFVKGAVWGDIDNDDRPDLFLSRRGEPNVLLRNNGPDENGRWTFTDVSRDAGVEDPLDSFPTWFWDYDNDGWLDIFVSGYRSQFGDVAAEYLGEPHNSELPRLYRNRGDGTFADVTAAAHLNRIMAAMGANFGDLDNDGHLDLYASTGDMDFRALVPNRMFRNTPAGVFQDVTTSGGFGHLQKGHGVAFGDLDNDGDQDLYVVMGGAYEGDVAYDVLFENPGHGNAWVTLRLEGVETNRAAIGARIAVTVDTPDGPRHIHRVVSSGGSFGASSLQQEIGLGRAEGIRAIAIRWPTSGIETVYQHLEANRTYLVREGDATPTVVPTTRFSFPKRSADLSP